MSISGWLCWGKAESEWHGAELSKRIIHGSLSLSRSCLIVADLQRESFMKRRPRGGLTCNFEMPGVAIRCKYLCYICGRGPGREKYLLICDGSPGLLEKGSGQSLGFEHETWAGSTLRSSIAMWLQLLKQAAIQERLCRSL